MEVNGEVSDTDSGIILHSGSDSPTTHTKDVTTHTRAMKLKHQALQDRLELCILELKKLCIREAVLTGRLSDDYPLLPGEKPPQIRRRIGAAFKLDEQSILQGTEESELSLVDAELALQMKIYEAARKLCKEDHLSKAVKKSRSQQCKREERKLKQLQDTSFQLRMKHGRSSPLPAFNITQLDLGTSDDSSLSDSVVQDEEVTSQSSQPSSGLPYPVETDPPQPPTESSLFTVDGSWMSPSVDQLLTPNQSPHPSFDSSLSLNSSSVYDTPPIQHSPWTESSLDQPYQKSKKSRSSIKTSSPAKSELLPPLEACLAQSALPLQLSHLRLSRAQSSSMPSTPEMRVHRQLSLRLSNPESQFEKDRGRTRGPRRRLTEYAVTFPETPPPTVTYGSHASSEDGNSEHSFTSYNSSPCQELPCELPKQYQSAFPCSSPVGSYGPQAFPHSGFYHNSRHLSSPSIHKAYYNEMVYSPDTDMPRSYYAQQASCPPNRYNYRYKDPAVPHQRAQRPLPPDIRLSPSPAQWDHPHYCSSGLPRQVVNEQLKSWQWRSQLKSPRSRSLDRQGAVRVKNIPVRESPCYQIQKYHEQEEVEVCRLKPNTEIVSGSSGSLPMSGRNGSASDADCQISEDCQVPDVELMELGPLLDEGGGRQAASKGVYPEGAAMLAEEEEEDDEVGEVLTLPLQAHHAMEKMEEFVHKVWEGRWRVIPFHVLPEWLKDNDYLLHGHRPPMPSFRACFGSIFRIHTETGNIWTHLLGLILFICLGTLTMLRPNMYFMAPLQEKVVFGMFFLGAVLCLSFSWLFHTVYCHSEKVSRTFSKLDYSGIALLIMGSFVPWLYYSFYCSPQPRLIYLTIVCVLGIAAIIVAQWDRFSTPRHRPTRAGVFMGLGLSGIVPTMHFTIEEGFVKATTVGQMGWFYLMGAMYITGAGLYAARIPERYFPGKCDIWFHSHQIFHVLVVAAAFIHFYGVSNLQEFRYGLEGGCTDDTLL
ncbi:putative adiponectin receptor protein 1 [Scophthalmus maximus]|uniref:Putative adiponectin receptor protein 1 n=1 Tax=Scophthalmus maximus TaxID=52904 RepID=A0A2U9BH07_SCOMX|nr:putative adiponectin receptor protein 1 [Scophthalmus maximus]